jgi:hypothetical protein
VPVAGGHRRHGRDVGAGREGLLPRSGHHHGPHAGVGGEGLRCRGEVAERLAVERVQDARPVQAEDPDPVVTALEEECREDRRGHRQYSGLRSKKWCASMKRTVRVAERITTELVIAPPFT